ncbi:MAG: iron-containing alcohol dehydrogenase family protein [Actinobacteria bacterium]|nr:iron-containing alcohol dehydrogenase family protein [Actinomycetota bacterium]
MPLLTRNVPAPVAIEVRAGAVAGLTPLLADGRISSGGRVAVAVGPGQGADIAAQVAHAVPSATVMTINSGSLDGALELISSLRTSWYDAVVGIGGGKTLDAAKYAASMVGLPFVAVATNLSNDGLASPVASLESHGRKASFGVHIPIAVFVDIDYVRKAPLRHTRSGIGDVVSNLSAVADWQLAGAVNDEPVDGLAVAMARSAAEALVSRTDPIDDDAFLSTLAESLILSGLAMTVAGTSRPCSGGCHEISHALDASHGSPGLHGEQVGMGALFASWLRDDMALVAPIDACLQRYGLPRVPADLGVSTDDFCAAVLEAPDTRPDRFTILEHLAMDKQEVRERVDAFIAAFGR